MLGEIDIENPLYPTLLKEISGAPNILFMRGELPRQSDICVSIVGTRKVTREGRKIAYTLALELARKGIVVVSGLALGVDAAAHEGALSQGGRTIAVLAHGLDIIYPRQHEKLAIEILRHKGGIVSEYPVGTRAFPNQFLERNRIISGLSAATIVVEAPLKSGAMVTARHAAEQGREVFITPGPADHPHYAGSHLLIRNGARLVRDIRDVFEDLHELLSTLPLGGAPLSQKNDLDEISSAILTLLEEKPGIRYHDIVDILPYEAHHINERITLLTLEGKINEHSGSFSL